MLKFLPEGILNDKLNKGICTNVQEGKEAPTLGKERRRNATGLFFTGFGVTFIYKKITLIIKLILVLDGQTKTDEF